MSRGKKERERRIYWESGGGKGEGEREVLTLSKLANRSASRTLWRGGEEGAKGSAKGSLAGREEEEEEEEKSPEVCGRKCPRRWKESEDSVLEMDDLLPGQVRHRKAYGDIKMSHRGNEWKDRASTNKVDFFYRKIEQFKYWPGGGGGGLVGVPVFGGRAGGMSGLADWLSSWNRFLLLMSNWSAPFDWNHTE